MVESLGSVELCLGGTTWNMTSLGVFRGREGVRDLSKSMSRSPLCLVVEVLGCLHVSSGFEQETGVSDSREVVQSSEKGRLVPPNSADVLHRTRQQFWAVAHDPDHRHKQQEQTRGANCWAGLTSTHAYTGCVTWTVLLDKCKIAGRRQGCPVFHFQRIAQQTDRKFCGETKIVSF